MSRNVVIATGVILVLIVAGWFLTRPKQIMAPEVITTQSTSLVTISSTGFSPKDITVKVGTVVTWTNSDSENHTVNSDPHPTHTLNAFLNLGVIKSAEKKSVTVSEVGKFTYHDHLNSSLKGSITVE